MENNQLINKKPAIKQTWLRIILFILMYLIGTGLISIIFGILFMIIRGLSIQELQAMMGSSGNMFMMVFFQFMSLIAAGLSIWVFRKFIDKKSILSLGFNIKGRFRDIVAGFLLGFILQGLGFIILYYSNQLTVTEIVFNANAFLGSLLMFIIVGVVEESVMRGYILCNLMEHMKNRYLALLISALIFAVFHGLNPNITVIGLINLILAGFVLGIAYIHTRNLWFPIFLHISWNFFQGPVFGFEVSGMDTKAIINHDVIGNDLITGGRFGFEGSILITIILVIITFSIDLYYRKKTIN
ncbi:MAG TPA: type II CAAX endopeptidase family protein [Bacteroidales bacterium]|nr:type II CAAX endopeptidase family protein [Bacteroidales bacterium]